MTNRIVLGNKGGTFGLWVSKSSFDVLTASSSQMLFSSEHATPQIIHSASVYFAARNLGSSGTETVTHMDFGFRPFVVMHYTGLTETELEQPNVINYRIYDRSTAQFSFTRPGILINSNTQYKAFTLEYRLLSIGPDNI